MPSETLPAAKAHRKQSPAARQQYLKIPYTYVRLIVSTILALCVVMGAACYRIQQYNATEHVTDDEYTKLLNKYNELEAEANALTAKLNAQEDRNDNTVQTINQQAAKLNEKDAQFSQDLDEFQQKTDELQAKLDELEKAKEEILNELNDIPFLPTEARNITLTQPIPLAVSFSSSPVQLLGYKLDSLSNNTDIELSSYQELTDTIEGVKPILENYPSIWPVKGQVTSKFGKRQNPMGGLYEEVHTGLDIAVPTCTSVKATGGGVVKFAGNDGGYGNLVIIDHGMGMETYYGHNSQLLVKAGEKVERGQVVAKSGSTGNSTGPHVHYEVRINGTCVNPDKYVVLSD
jgi:murein DD-endopeptidase MepM/ murein hydrolase activator NlpD